MNCSQHKSLFACFLFLGVIPSASSQATDDAEYPVKLSFLYHFAQFVVWPAAAFRDPNAPLTICIAGQDPFDDEMEQAVRSRKIAGHPIEIRSLKQSDDPRACHMVFIPTSEKKRTGGILSALKTSNTLTVGETAGFAEGGGDINLTRDERTLRFEVNVRAASRSGLQISSRLLALAKIVTPQQEPGIQ